MYNLSNKPKNYLPLLILLFLLWLSIGYIFTSIPPQSSFVIGFFLILITLTIFLTLSLLLKNSSKGFLLTLVLIILLILKKLGQMNLLNLLVLLTILIVSKSLIRRSTRKHHSKKIFQ